MLNDLKEASMLNQVNFYAVYPYKKQSCAQMLLLTPRPLAKATTGQIGLVLSEQLKNLSTHIVVSLTVKLLDAAMVLEKSIGKNSTQFLYIPETKISRKIRFDC